VTKRATIEITWEPTSAISDADVQGFIESAVDRLMERLSIYGGLDPAVFAAFDANAMTDGNG
jgi:hypothetical protein